MKITQQHLEKTAEHFVARFDTFALSVDEGFFDDTSLTVGQVMLREKHQECISAIHALSILMIQAGIPDFEPEKGYEAAITARYYKAHDQLFKHYMEKCQ